MLYNCFHCNKPKSKLRFFVRHHPFCSWNNSMQLMVVLHIPFHSFYSVSCSFSARVWVHLHIALMMLRGCMLWIPDLYATVYLIMKPITAPLRICTVAWILIFTSDLHKMVGFKPTFASVWFYGWMKAVWPCVLLCLYPEGTLDSAVLLLI